MPDIILLLTTALLNRTPCYLHLAGRWRLLDDEERFVRERHEGVRLQTSLKLPRLGEADA